MTSDSSPSHVWVYGWAKRGTFEVKVLGSVDILRD